MTLEERRAAEFFVHLMRANLNVPAERSRLRHELYEQLMQIGHIDIVPSMRIRGMDWHGTLPLGAFPDDPDDVDEDRILRPLFDRILDHLRDVCGLLVAQLAARFGLTGLPVPTSVTVEFQRQDDGSIVATVHAQDYLTDLFWLRFLPLLQLKPCPFVLCDQCSNPFVRADKGPTPKYCSKSCKDKSIPFASRRADYMRERRQTERAQQLRLARDAIRQDKIEQEQRELLSKALPQKSRRALVQLLNEARRRQKRSKLT